MGARHVWPQEGVSRIPYWIYSDPEIYSLEQERIFCGPSWSYVALEAELPRPGDFKRTFIGEKPVVVVRDQEGSINVAENRCAHRGVQKQGGMPADFDPKNHGLRKLKVARRHGVIFASFASDLEPLEEYFGPSMLALYDRVFDGRELRVLGYSRQLTPANWKLMFENIKDPYHASLLHVFLVSFGLFRADQPSKVQMDATGRHGALISWRGEQ